MSFHRISLPALLATLGLACIAAPVRAEDAQTQTRQIQTADLDLHTEAGAAVLRHRVRVASRQVCGEPSQFGTPDDASYNACVERAEQQAMKTSERMIAAVRTGSQFAAATPSN